MKEFPAAFVLPWSSGPLAQEIPDIFRHGCRRAAFPGRRGGVFVFENGQNDRRDPAKSS